jgi:hypothetical protein
VPCGSSYCMSDNLNGPDNPTACNNKFPANTDSTSPPGDYPCGISYCLPIDSVAALSTTSSMFSKGASYACVVAIALVLGAAGYVVHGIRSKEARLVTIGMLSICRSFALSGAALVSEFLNLFILFTLGYGSLTSIILVVRMFHVLPTVYCIARIFGMSYCQDVSYGAPMARPHFLENSYMYAAVAFLSLLESSIAIYLS